jgi:hypothetical protein
MAEWLGTGLQNLLQRFESASDLHQRKYPALRGIFFVCARPEPLARSGGRMQKNRLRRRLLSMNETPFQDGRSQSASDLYILNAVEHINGFFYGPVSGFRHFDCSEKFKKIH